MIGNILILLIVVGLVGLFGWLTYRAIRAQKVWKKIVGGLLAGLVTLVAAAIAFFAGKGIAAAYFPGADPAPNISVAGTAEQVARGEYLVNMSCIGCHSAVDADGNPSEQHPLSGGWNISAAEGFGFAGDMVTENLTPGGKLASYTDGEIFRLLRTGIKADGDLAAFMSLMPYTGLSDADTEAVIAYLRTLEPVEQPVPTGDKLSFLGAVAFGAGLFGNPEPSPASITAPVEGISVEYGRYVTVYGECSGCHGPDMTGTPASAFFPAIPNPRLLVSEISQEQFVAMMRTGVKPDGQAFPEGMPWQNASKMTENDLAALYAYLTAPVN